LVKAVSYQNKSLSSFFCLQCKTLQLNQKRNLLQQQKFWIIYDVFEEITKDETKPEGRKVFSNSVSKPKLLFLRNSTGTFVICKQFGVAGESSETIIRIQLGRNLVSWSETFFLDNLSRYTTLSVEREIGVEGEKLTNIGQQHNKSILISFLSVFYSAIGRDFHFNLEKRFFPFTVVVTTKAFNLMKWKTFKLTFNQLMLQTIKRPQILLIFHVNFNCFITQIKFNKKIINKFTVKKIFY
jgi:hypothetical protein